MATSSSRARAKRKTKTPPSQQSFQTLDDLLKYISDDWKNLQRAADDCKTYEDSKTRGVPSVYVPADVKEPADLRQLQQKCNVEVLKLPEKINENQASTIRPHGLLYLEHPYVVPGGQFNEMYGWDSYFIVRGLLRSGRTELAKGMVENFFYEIDHYGGVINANRTYYIGRSQPPLLSSMILAIYDAGNGSGGEDLKWLRRGYDYAVRDYDQWIHAPHLAGDTGLSRYFDAGDGPVPEIMGDPDHYYQRAAQYFLKHEGENSAHLVKLGGGHTDRKVLGPRFELSVCEPASATEKETHCEPQPFGLSADYYKGDRSMRESGFDVTFRFGPYGAKTHHYAPVCLNNLLYKTENDLAEMAELLGRTADAAQWKARAAERREKMQEYFWDASKGLFFDYDIVTHKRSSYVYATTFYPLWTGSATDEEARAVEKNLQLFEKRGGIVTSLLDSSAQWDYPYGWAPLNLFAIEGLRRYGYTEDANRVSEKFLSMIFDNFRSDHTIREKYDVVERSSRTHIGTGYAQNETGFGWTNAVLLELLHAAPPEMVERLKKE